MRLALLREGVTNDLEVALTEAIAQTIEARMFNLLYKETQIELG